MKPGAAFVKAQPKVPAAPLSSGSAAMSMAVIMETVCLRQKSQ